MFMEKYWKRGVSAILPWGVLRKVWDINEECLDDSIFSVGWEVITYFRKIKFFNENLFKVFIFYFSLLIWDGKGIAILLQLFRFL